MNTCLDPPTEKNETTATTPHRPLSPRSVKFADEEQVHNVLKRRSQFSRQSIADIWFQGDDFEDFMDEIDYSVEKLEQGKRLKDKKYSSLGLESLTEEGSALRRAYQEDAWDAVLWEQHYQREDGKRSSVQISQLYREVSRDAEQRAVEIALRVHREVMKFCTQDDLTIAKRFSDRTRNDKRRRSSSLSALTRTRIAA